MAKKFILKATAKTKKEKDVKIGMATLIASSPYISRKRKHELIREIK